MKNSLIRLARFVSREKVSLNLAGIGMISIFLTVTGLFLILARGSIYLFIISALIFFGLLILDRIRLKYYRNYVKIDDEYFTPITLLNPYNDYQLNWMHPKEREKASYNPCKKCIYKRHCTECWQTVSQCNLFQEAVPGNVRLSEQQMITEIKDKTIIASNNRNNVVILQGKKSFLINAGDEIITSKENLGSLNYTNEPELSSFTDSRDGNIYKTVKIGPQIWMSENLRYIPFVCLLDEEGGIWVYDYDGHNIKKAISQKNYKKYGCLYDWATAKSICPDGWHLPSYEEWTQLLNNIGPVDSVEDELKSLTVKSITIRNAFYAGAININGCMALLGGNRNLGNYNLNVNASFYFSNTCWWSSTDADNPIAAWVYDKTLKTINKSNGVSVRCVKDN
jgi:uncharacterized protein (TIGR02145 family)